MRSKNDGLRVRAFVFRRKTKGFSHQPEFVPIFARVWHGIRIVKRWTSKSGTGRIRLFGIVLHFGRHRAGSVRCHSDVFNLLLEFASLIFHRPWLGSLWAVVAAAAGTLSATAHGQIEFNPLIPTSVVDLGGFTGQFSPQNPYTRAVIVFQFFGLPNPFVDTFQITDISLKGTGITSSLSFTNLEVDGLGEEGFYFSNTVALNSSVSNLNFSSSTLSFNLPGGKINEGASFDVSVQYRNLAGTQVATSTGVEFVAVAVPEQSTSVMAAGGLACTAWVAYRRRRTTRLSGKHRRVKGGGGDATA